MNKEFKVGDVVVLNDKTSSGEQIRNISHKTMFFIRTRHLFVVVGIRDNDDIITVKSLESDVTFNYNKVWLSRASLKEQYLRVGNIVETASGHMAMVYDDCILFKDGKIDLDDYNNDMMDIDEKSNKYYDVIRVFKFTGYKTIDAMLTYGEHHEVVWENDPGVELSEEDRVNNMTDREYFDYVKESLLRDFRFGWMTLINSTTAIIEDHWPGAMGTSYSKTIFKGPVDDAIAEYIKNNKRRVK